MKKLIIASILSAGFIGSAMATGPAVQALANVSTFASAGNGGTSHSTAGTFAVGNGSSSAYSGKGFLSVTVPVCDPRGKTIDYTSTVLGTVTSVSGEANTMGGSYAKNVSTGNGSGAAHADSIVSSDVTRSLNGVGGEAYSMTQTWANAGTNQSRSAFATQSAEFESKGATGYENEIVTKPGWWQPTVVFVGQGANATGTSDVSKSYQVYSLGSTHCGSGCQAGPGSEVAGSNTYGYASTFATVGGWNPPQQDSK